jgi:hypothetical protein
VVVCGRCVRGLVGLVGVVVCGLVVAACGGSGGGGGGGGEGAGGGLPVGVVAVFGGRVVSFGLVDHWAVLEGRLAREEVPVPPAFTQCIRNFEGSDRDPGAKVVARYRYACEGNYIGLQTRALTYLLRLMWDEQLAAEQHLSVSAKEVQEAYRVYTQREYPGAALAELYARTGMSVADEALRIKKNMLEGKLELALVGRLRRVQGRGAAALAAQNRILVGSEARLLDETNCRKGFVVEVCRQYRGTMREVVKS